MTELTRSETFCIAIIPHHHQDEGPLHPHCPSHSSSTHFISPGDFSLLSLFQPAFRLFLLVMKAAASQEVCAISARESLRPISGSQGPDSQTEERN